MSTCSDCGTSYGPSDSFCQGCGKKLGGSPALQGRRVRVGREADNDLVIGDHQQVSRHHVVVTIAPEGQLFIEDTGTRNGTKVDGARIDGPTPFTLHSDIQLGSYLLNTAMLQPFMERSSGRPGEVTAATGGGYKRVALEPLEAPQGYTPAPAPYETPDMAPLMVRAFQGRHTWLGGFTLFTGIVCLILFVCPMLATPQKLIFPFMLIGKPGVDDLMQVCLILMPIVGLTLIIFKATNLGNVTYSIALACVLFIGLGSNVGASDSLPVGRNFHTWHVVMKWLFQVALCAALFVLSARPTNAVARTFVGILAGLGVLFFLLPATRGSESQIYVVALFKATKLHGALYVLVILELSRLLLAGLCFMFMGVAFTRRRPVLPQSFANAMITLIVAQPLVMGFAMAAQTEQSTFVLLGVWMSAFTWVTVGPPAIGLAGIFSANRPHPSHR